MQVDRFKDSPTGRLVPISVEEGGRTVEHVAFVPNPLPAEFDLSSKTWSTAIDAGHNGINNDFGTVLICGPSWQTNADNRASKYRKYVYLVFFGHRWILFTSAVIGKPTWVALTTSTEAMHLS